MSTATLTLMILQGLLFIVWAYLMFSTLFLLTRRARRETSEAFPNPIAALKQWRLWFTSKEDRIARLRLGFCTLALIGLSFILALRS